MKFVISQMEANILFLNEAVENLTKLNIKKIVAVVAASLESKKEADIT